MKISPSSRRRKLLLGLATALAAPGWSHAQIAKPVPRVAVIFGGSPDTDKPRVEAFLQGMTKLGYVDGQNVARDIRFLEGKLDRYPEIVGDVLGRKPGVIVLGGSSAIWAAKKATTTVPIFMATVADPVGQGLITSFARPGGNITGMAILAELLESKRFELMRELLPTATRFGYLTNLSNPAAAQIALQFNADAKRVGVEIVQFNANKESELDDNLSAIAQRRPQAVIVGQDTLYFSYRKKVADFLARYRIPAIYSFAETVTDGGLMSYTPNLTENWRKIPSSILLRADRVIE